MTDWLKGVIDSLKLGATVVTVNRRLSRHLRAAFKEAMCLEGRGAWETPVIVPLGAWVSKLYAESGAGCPVLDDSRSRALWGGIVERGCSNEELAVLSSQGVAETSFSAYRLMGEYCIPASGLGPELYMSEEARAFKGWLIAYANKLKSTGFIDATLLKDRTVELIERGEVALPARVLFAGFDETTPSVRKLSGALEEAGVCVEEIGSGTAVQVAPPVIKEFPNEVDEVRAAARWVRQRLATSGSVGVAVTDLNRYGALLEREFRAELDPVSVLPWQASAGVFNISLGTALYGYPVIRTAFGLLSVQNPDADIEPIDALLNHFSIGESSLVPVVRFQAWLAKRKIVTATLRELKRLMEEGGKGSLGAPVRKLGKWIEFLENESARALPGYWARRFASVLELLGWPLAVAPEGGGLSSAVYQVVEAWRSLLVEFSCLDDTLGRLTRKGAVAHLKRLATGTLFQVESPDSPVQVLGLFEMAGLNFEHLLLLGADSAVLPAPQSPNPFIPVEVQKRHDLKDSSPERTLGFAQAVLKRVLESGKSVEVSYARTFDGVDSTVSPLLREYGAGVGEPVKVAVGGSIGSSLKERLHASCLLERMPAGPDVPLSEEEREGFRGGTSIIKDQSACPFKAFATHRLGARGIEGVEPGFDALDRGNTVHKSLELFWREVKGSKRLKELEKSAELAEYVTRAVQKALAQQCALRKLPEAYVELERLRTEALVTEWLALESSREEFEVLGTECTKEIEVSGLKLKARLDRVDRVGDEEVIIDYKTGACSKDGWNPDRPREPQMLLYGLAGDFDAITFARVRLKETRFVGVAKDGHAIPGVEALKDDKWTQKIVGVESWDDLRLRWKETLEALADEFIRGVASVTPDSKAGSNNYPCDKCNLTTLCRRFELNVEPERKY